VHYLIPSGAFIAVSNGTDCGNGNALFRLVLMRRGVTDESLIFVLEWDFV
jgi:hypothetical protein